jgi:serine acetyltransferase
MGTILGHDTILEDRVMIASGANIAGHVHLGQDCSIGAGAVILEDLSIGSDAIIMAGAVVIRDVDPGTTVAGIPAKIVQQNS